MSTDPDILEKNVSTLLETGGEAPRIAPAARARILAHLLATHGAPVRAAAAWARPRNLAIGAGALALAAALALWIAARGAAPVAPLAAGGDTAVALADGTTVVRDVGATVTVLGPRHVRVEGEALLDVAPGQGRFVVDTVHGRIEVLGTRFLVDATAARTTAAVIRGEVQLSSDQGDVQLHAGEQGIASPGVAPTRGPAPRLSHLASWAQAARRKLEHAEPVHHGTLFARQPNQPGAPEQPLPLAKLAVDVVVENQVARVALDQTFHNPAAAALEGMYRFAIPPDAALQRLAMYVDGRLEESAVVERMAARRIYEEQVYRRVDPALLEWAGTGRLALRVYPLHAQQDKRLVLAYTQSLPKLYDDWTLTVPLPEVDEPVGELTFSVRVRGCASCELTSPSHAIQVTRAGDDAVVHYAEKGARAGDSLVLHVRDLRSAPTVASHRDGDDRYLLVRAPAALAAGPAAYRPRTWVILDDVSASRDAMARRAQRDLIDGFLRELDEDDRVAVVAFDVSARVALPPTRVLDVDRAAVQKALADEGEVGATDLGAGLDAALAQLAGATPDDAMIVYLGDGVITSGTRHLDELRAKLAGKAHFVGVGVGDGADTQTLDALAAATAGYATTIDLADDVGWRAFDLVAALHTARVTGIAARLVDAAGAPIAATLYGPAQVADGEELEVVGKLASAARPVALELTGTLAGQPWTRRIAVDDTAAGADAGYAPRLWAQRHIAARLLAKHEPVVVPACPIATRGAPACRTETELRDARDEVIRRDVVELGKRYFLLSRHTSLLVLENDAMYAQYGIVKGAGDTWAPYALPATMPVVAATGTPIPTPSDGELVRAPVQLFDAFGGGYPQDDLELRGAQDKEGDWRDRPQAVHAGPVRDVLLSAELGMRGRATAAAEAVEKKPAGATDLDDRADPLAGGEAGDVGKSAPIATPTPMASTASDGVLEGGIVGDGIDGGGGGLRLSQGYLGHARAPSPFAASLAPVAYRLRSPDDAAFSDLTGFVPALFPDAADAWRRELVAGPHTIDATARARLAAARAALPTGVYRWGDLELAVDDARRLGWRRTTDADLVETASFDGATWTRRYAELGLDATRAVGDDDVALALGYLPIWIAAPEHWARFFDVRARGDHEVVLARGDQTAFVLTFDAAAHLTSVRDGAGRDLITVAWSAAGPTAARIDGEDVRVGFTGQAIADAPAWAHRDAAPSSVVIELPGRVAAAWDAPRAALTAGTPEWRRVVRQHMVALAAVHAEAALVADYRELLAHGGAELGDLVLASEGVARMPTPGARVALPPSAVARYLRGGAEPGDHGEPGFLGALGALRAITADLAAERSAAAVATLAQLGTRAPVLRLVAVSAIASWGVRPQDQARAWDTFATGPYHNIARAQAATAYAQAGLVEEAATRWAALAADYDLNALPASFAPARSAFQASRRGAAGWDIAVAQLQGRVLASGALPHVVALLATADAPADRMRVLTRAAELAAGDPAQLAQLARLAAQVGERAWAMLILAPLVARAPTREVDQLAGRLALQEGHVAEALADLEQAQGLGADEAAPIQTVRAELSELITVAQRLAAESTGAARHDAVARAVRWGQRWRAIDPGNSMTDMALGGLMLSVGDTAAAWRQLSTMIERDPMAGAGYEAIADVFERQGKVAEALDYWEQALRLDQTDPTPRLRKAQALYALGKPAEGEAAVRDILGHRWHERWAGTVERARQLLQQRQGGWDR